MLIMLYSKHQNIALERRLVGSLIECWAKQRKKATERAQAWDVCRCLVKATDPRSKYEKENKRMMIYWQYGRSESCRNKSAVVALGTYYTRRTV